MAIPGDTTHRVVEATDHAGNAVTTLTTGDLTVSAHYRTDTGSWATWTHNAALTQISGGRYGLAFALPPVKSWWDLRITASGVIFAPGAWQGETENYDRDRLTGLVARPVAVLSSGTQLGALQNLSVVARRWRRIAIQINDQTGTAVDLSTYDAWRIGIRSSDGASKWESGIGTHKVTGLNISGDAAGLLTVELPENLSRATARGNTTAYALGDVVQAGDLVAICTTAGTSAGSAPTWPTTAGQSVSDGTVTWETLSDPWELFDSALAADPNLTQLNLRYEIAANDSGNVARTVPIIRSSTLSVSGYEVATTYEDPSA